MRSSPRAYIIVGRVVSVDETNCSCQVLPDKDNIPQLENVPLRVYNLENDLGIIVIPENNSPCQVGFIEGDPELPIMLKVQRWRKIIIKKHDTFELIIDADGNVDLKTQGNLEGEVEGDMSLKVQGLIQLGPKGQHKALFGDILVQKFNSHSHPIISSTQTGPPAQMLTDPQVNSQKVKLD